MFYIQDTESGKQESLGTKDRTEAVSILNARNEAVRQPHLNLQIAKAYLAGTDSGVADRTWQNAAGALFPKLALVKEKHRAKEFKRRCVGLGITGVSLHSYRYAWAERAKQCGYPERFAQEALRHNSKAVHRAYARKAKVRLPSLESYEQQAADNRIIELPSPLCKTAIPDALLLLRFIFRSLV